MGLGATLSTEFKESWTQLCHSISADLAGLQVGVYASGGAPFHHLALATLWGADARPIHAETIHGGALENLDVLIFPGGGFTAMTGMLEPLGVKGAEQVRNWVEAGGMYLGSCAGSFLPAQVGEAYWGAHEEARALHMVNAPLANSSDSIFEGLSSPGVGTVEVSVVDQTHWLTEGLPERFEIVHYNGPLFDLQESDNASGLDAPTGVMRPVGATQSFTPSEGFLGEPPEETLLTSCIRQNAFNGIETSFGKGHVVLFGSHPEFGFDVVQLGWREAVKLLANALKFQARKRKSARSDSPTTLSSTVLGKMSEKLETIAQHFHTLHRADTNGWLEGAVPSFLGRDASTIWSEASDRAAQVALGSAELLRKLSHTDAQIEAFWLDSAPLVNQDVGFIGLEQLLFLIEDQLLLALKQLKTTPLKLRHAYDGFETHPYQIAVSSYLSAAGLTAAAHLLCVTVAKASHKGDMISLDFLVEESFRE